MTSEESQPEDSAPFDQESTEESGETASTLSPLEAERNDLYSRLQRVSADYQNFMRRADQQLADAVDFARGDLLRNFIPLIDDFDRALEVKPSDEGTHAMHDGLKMLRDAFLKALQSAGVERIDAKPGEPFDPHHHEALMQQAVEGMSPGCVAMAMQSGYVYKNRTLRAAKVAVTPSA